MHRIIWWSLLSTAMACKPTPIPSVPTDSSSIDAEAPADTATQADGGKVDITDVGAEIDVDAGVSLTDAATDAQDASNGQDTDDGGVAADAAPPPAVCTATALPEPSQPCDKEGTVRCTNWQGSVSKQDGTCLRPHRVACVKTSAGLFWELQSCGQVPKECDYFGSVPTTCQENSRGASCCPVLLVVTNQMNKIYSSYTAICHNEGSVFCPGETSDFLFTCGFPDTGPTHALAKTETEKAFGKCLALCKDCLHVYAKDKCPFLNIGGCNKDPKELALPKPFCLTTIPGKGPTCAQDCQDFKYSSFAKP